MVNTILVVNGTARSGKNTFVSFLAKHSNVQLVEMSSVDTIKAIARQHFGWDGKKDERGRQLLSDLKDAWSGYIDGPFGEMVGNIQNLDASSQDFVTVAYIREPEEIAKLVSAFPGRVKTMLITRHSPKYNNHADCNTTQFMYDFIISNRGTIGQLSSEAKRLADLLGIVNVT
jgi:hypothetical protein